MHSSPSGRLKKSLRKQIFLFGLSVLLPAFVLFVFIVRMNRQDSELRKNRAMEAQQLKAEEIGRNMAERLGKAERVLRQALAEEPENVQDAYTIFPDLLFVGRIIEDELKLPWEGSQTKKLLFETGRTGRLVLDAQRAEVVDNDLLQAKSLLNQALSSAASPSQEGFVQIELGRVLSKLGDEEGISRLYREMLGRSGDLTDEYGIPFALFAADRLSTVSSDVEPILVRFEALFDEIRWLPPRALHYINDIVDRIQSLTKDSRQLERALNLSRSIERGLEDLKRLELLKSYISGWTLRLNSREQSGDLSAWESYGDIPWLLGIRELNDDKIKSLLVFEGPAVLSLTIEESGLAKTLPGICRMAVGPNGEGFLPGASFQGFRLRFDETDVSAWSRSSLPFPVLYWLILFLVVGFTAFGTFLLWRDVSRELAIAEMRSHFAASVSHELKTPLTSIRMFAEALTMGVKKKPEEQKDYLQTIISESERLSRLLNNVLDFSKIEEGTRTYRFETTSLEEIVRAAEKTMAFPLKQKGFNLQIEVERGIPQVIADRDALEQAVLNLLHNAMKYSGESREIFLKLYRNENMACIDVLDFGIGIEEKNKDHIFGKFFRVPGAENQKIPGTGLGLTIVSHIAHAHEGRVEVTSRPDEGSTFSFLLPLEDE